MEFVCKGGRETLLTILLSDLVMSIHRNIDNIMNRILTQLHKI